MKRLFLLLSVAAFLTSAAAQNAKLRRQHSFAKTVPAGNFSGIAPIGDGRYAVVDDKMADGFYVFHVDIHPSKGKLRAVTNEGFRASGLPNRDAEDIVYVPQSNTLFINGEADSRVIEYSVGGQPTGRELTLPEQFLHPSPNRGIEALAHDALADRFWLTTESMLPADKLLAERPATADKLSADGSGERLRLLSVDGQTLRPLHQYLYIMDAPAARKAGRVHVKGVSAMTSLPDHRLLVLERECYLPKRKVGAWVECRLYAVNPMAAETAGGLQQDSLPTLSKQLVCRWRTRNLRFANYEGMCLGPVLDDGRQTLLLVSDSQNQYGSLLKDWFKVIILR